jgi:hypothetical protein
MINAKNEFLIHTNSKPKIKAVYVRYYPFDNNQQELLLKESYSEEDFDKFLIGIDFDYENDFGCQDIHGTIWYKDGTWSTRDEYHGCEWWEYHKLPQIPDCLKG